MNVELRALKRSFYETLHEIGSMRLLRRDRWIAGVALALVPILLALSWQIFVGGEPAKFVVGVLPLAFGFGAALFALAYVLVWGDHRLVINGFVDYIVEKKGRRAYAGTVGLHGLGEKIEKLLYRTERQTLILSVTGLIFASALLVASLIVQLFADSVFTLGSDGQPNNDVAACSAALLCAGLFNAYVSSDIHGARRVHQNPVFRFFYYLVRSLGGALLFVGLVLSFNWFGETTDPRYAEIGVLSAFAIAGLLIGRLMSEFVTLVRFEDFGNAVLFEHPQKPKVDVTPEVEPPKAIKEDEEPKAAHWDVPEQ